GFGIRRASRRTRLPYTTLFRSGVGTDEVGFFVGADGGDDFGSEEFRGLDRGDAESAGTGLDEDGFAGLERGFVHEVEPGGGIDRSEEHTSELQSRENLVCRLLL